MAHTDAWRAHLTARLSRSSVSTILVPSVSAAATVITTAASTAAIVLRRDDRLPAGSLPAAADREPGFRGSQLWVGVTRGEIFS